MTRLFSQEEESVSKKGKGRVEEGFLFPFRRRRSVKPHFDTYDNGQKLSTWNLSKVGLRGRGLRNDVINVFMGDRRTLIPSMITHNSFVITVERIRSLFAFDNVCLFPPDV